MNKNVFFAIFFTTFAYLACNDEFILTDSSAKPEFSTDTVLFDTVFTDIGSYTLLFKVYNRENGSINISEISLAGGNNSQFRLNIDGFPGNDLKDKLLHSGDSLFIFAEVTVNPKDSESPFVVEDSIKFVTNGNTQFVQLRAWGQDVTLINGEIIQSAIWKKGKPYLVYNSMRIATGETLEMQAGTKVYFHDKSQLQVFGTLKTLGTLEEPVLLTSDKIDAMYKEAPGKWYGIIIVPESSGNELHNTVISNGTFGIQIGDLETPLLPDLTMHNVEIKNMSVAGIWANKANIKAYNAIVANCGISGIWIAAGGNYEFAHLTLVNYWRYTTRSKPSLVLSNSTDYNGTKYTSPLVAKFYNSVINGSSENEIGFSQFEATPFTALFESCAIKGNKELNILDETIFKSCFKSFDAKFNATDKNDYRILETSELKDKGNMEVVNQFLQLLTYDFKGISRVVDQKPDIGAHEYVEIKKEK
ncbi:MAG TPA: hypothetical protein DCQ31_00285 [Bacteroidales bacterium]|nr:hypothetical protein [Bacteroidales bacterium]